MTNTFNAPQRNIFNCKTGILIIDKLPEIVKKNNNNKKKTKKKQKRNPPQKTLINQGEKCWGKYSETLLVFVDICYN